MAHQITDTNEPSDLMNLVGIDVETYNRMSFEDRVRAYMPIISNIRTMMSGHVGEEMVVEEAIRRLEESARIAKTAADS